MVDTPQPWALRSVGKAATLFLASCGLLSNAGLGGKTPPQKHPSIPTLALIYNARFAHFGNSTVTAPLFESTITSLPLISKGKVRDIYAIDDEKLLIVTTDRLSAFDVILPDPIPRKGEVLQAVANFWFEKLGHVVPNQLPGIDPESVVA